MSNGHSPYQPSVRPGVDEPRPATGGGPGGAPSEGMASGMKDMASEASEQLMNTAEEKKRAGADYVASIAAAARRAANEFDDEIPQAGEYIRSAAAQMESMAESFRRRDIGQMFSDVQSFARRQPTAFLGASFLAGFVAIRFLRSSSRNTTGPSDWRQREEVSDDGRYGSPRDDLVPNANIER